MLLFGLEYLGGGGGGVDAIFLDAIDGVDAGVNPLAPAIDLLDDGVSASTDVDGVAPGEGVDAAFYAADGVSEDPFYGEVYFAGAAEGEACDADEEEGLVNQSYYLHSRVFFWGGKEREGVGDMGFILTRR